MSDVWSADEMSELMGWVGTAGELSVELGKSLESVRGKARRAGKYFKETRYPPSTEAEKFCGWCKQYKLYSEFGKNTKSSPDGFTRSCRKCLKSRVNEDKRKKQSVRRNIERYGISEDEYWKMYEEQQGKCFLCGREEFRRHNNGGDVTRLSIDHSHKDDHVRKLLCSSCNTKLGWAEKIGLERLVRYVGGDYGEG